VLERVARDILGWLAVLLEQLCGPLGGWYLLDSIGEIPLVIDELKARIERLSLLEPMIRYSEKLSSSSQPALVKRCSMASLFTLLYPPTT